jgi:formylglycine-generating enzyme required for sulfatase activity
VHGATGPAVSTLPLDALDDELPQAEADLARAPTALDDLLRIGDAGSRELLAGAEGVWVPGFVIQRAPVTVGDYLRFLDALPHPTAESHQPLRQRSQGSEGEPLLRWTGRHWEAPTELPLSLPITSVRWCDAAAYAAWLAEVEGRPWRLPHSSEWEKAARGVDRRRYPWGDFCDPTWTNVSNATDQRPALTDTERWPEDVSLYGVLGMTGNVREMCGDLSRREGPLPHVVPEFSDEPGQRFVRGGAYTVSHTQAASAGRVVIAETSRYPSIGFRLARSLPQT